MTGRTHFQDVDLQIDGTTYVLHYDWLAIKRLRDSLGMDFEIAIAEAETDFDMEVIAEVVSIGLALHHADGPGKDDIMRMSPPVISVVKAVTAALNLAFHGSREAPKGLDPTLIERLMKIFPRRTLSPGR